MKSLILKIIRLYQCTLSPDHGYGRFFNRSAGCRFYPSCSQYMYEAVEKKGILKGLLLGAWRILRCNPWSRGGHDPVR
jgi:putative membrane protein insertion efficiency factor